MKIVKLIDIYGHTFYINPAYIVEFAENDNETEEVFEFHEDDGYFHTREITKYDSPTSIDVKMINGDIIKVDESVMSLNDFIKKVGEF